MVAMKTAKMDLAAKVLAILRENGHSEVAEDLHHWLRMLDSPEDNVRKCAVVEVQRRCHVRWLGDLYVANSSQKQWWGILEKLARAVRA